MKCERVCAPNAAGRNRATSQGRHTRLYTACPAGALRTVRHRAAEGAGFDTLRVQDFDRRSAEKQCGSYRTCVLPSQRLHRDLCADGLVAQ